MPLLAPVAGVAMGLIKRDDRFAVLTDIAGQEDHYGDMDFKVAGTRDGVTALQMDIKITGVTKEIMGRALEQARRGRLHILDEMEKAISQPRTEMSKFAPRLYTIEIPRRRSATSSDRVARRSARSSRRPAARSTSRTTAG